MRVNSLRRSRDEQQRPINMPRGIRLKLWARTGERPEQKQSKRRYDDC